MFGFRSKSQIWGLAGLSALVTILALMPMACGDDDDDNVDDEEPEGHEDYFCGFPPEHEACEQACVDSCDAELDVCFTGECGGYFEGRCENPGDNVLVPTAPEFEDYCQCLTDCYEELYLPCKEECDKECDEKYPCDCENENHC